MAQPSKNPPVKAADDSLDAIPMKKTNPMMALAIGGAVVVVIGVIAVTSMKKKDKIDPAAAASVGAVSTVGMTPEELKKHIELTRKAMEESAADDAKKKEAEAAKAAAAEAEKEKSAPAGGAAPAGGSPAPVAKAGGDEPAKPKAPTKTQKKVMSDLDKMGSDITGGLK